MTTTKPSLDRASPHRRIAPIRVAILCDFLEEKWPSMDLVGDMLYRHLAVNCADDVKVNQLRPVLRRRFTRVPFVREDLGWNADRLVNRFADYPLHLRNKGDDFDLFHIVDHSYAHLVYGLPAGRTVVTCHDLDTFRCLLGPVRENRPAWFRAMSRRILGGLQRASHVIAVSAATRDQLLERDVLPMDRISVVPNGVHPSCTRLSNPLADDAVSRLLPDDDPDRLWLLSVGNTLPRKRLDVLLRVFAAITRKIPKACLMRVGGLNPAQHQLAGELNIEHAMVNLPFLERELLAAVYRRADLLLHTAEAEGFGLPLIEAMACGCPVVASDVTVLREVGGDATSYCPVADVETWKETVIRLSRERIERPKMWELRRQQGQDHAARFSWAENARQTASIYRRVMEDK